MLDELSPVEQALNEWHGTEFYETADVSKARTVKSCEICSKTIRKGSSHIGFKFYGTDGNWPVFAVCNSCAEKYSEDLHLIEEFKSRNNDDN